MPRSIRQPREDSTPAREAVAEFFKLFPVKRRNGVGLPDCDLFLASIYRRGFVVTPITPHQQA